MDAVVYIRWSSVEQSKGSSLDRQREDCNRHAARKGWNVIAELIDDGVSAFKGRHAIVGELSRFVSDVEAGAYPSGVVLLAEKLDRFSRESAKKAFAWMVHMTDLGVVVATVDGDREYNRDNLDMQTIIEVIVKAQLANEESEKKSSRLSAAWAIKRARLARGETVVLTSRAPAWLTVEGMPPRFAVIAERAAIVRRVKTYEELDHTIEFVRGFVTCPYSDTAAEELVAAVGNVPGLSAYRLDQPLYADSAFPVVVVANDVELEADGTIRSRDALAWFLQQAAGEAFTAQVAETWWNIRSNLLGTPHGSRSSLFVNQHTGMHMRKILEAMNDSGMFGPVKEVSLDMLSQKKRDAICETLIRTAIDNWDKKSEDFEFEMRGEICKAHMRDIWDDEHEISVRVQISNFDLYVSGFYYPEDRKITHTDPRGKRALAEKFL